MRLLIAIFGSATLLFSGFVLGIYYTVAAADTSTLVRIVATVKGLIGL